MATRAPIMLAARIVPLPLGLAVAAAAFVHAASETERFWVGPGTSERFGLDAHIAAKIVDRGFTAEMVSYQSQAQGDQSQAQGDFPRNSASLIALARDSFAVDPLEVSSLRTIALGSLLQDDEDRARRLMRLAAQISKRDTIVNLWLAQDYGKAGDVEKMITSFDNALRTSRRAREYAMKPVVDALASEDTYDTLGELLASRPEWEPDFWGEFSRNPVGIANAANFFKASGIPVERMPEASRELLYANLKKTRQYDTLFALAALDPEARAGSDALAADKFNIVGGGNPLGWMLRSQGSYAARIHEKTGELQIDARSGTFGIAADRVVRGGASYRLAFAMAEPVPENAKLKLVARCADSSNREVASLPLGPGERAGEIAFVADGCAFVSLELSFTVDPGRRDALIRIASITLRPA
jgi:hypothetical protein